VPKSPSDPIEHRYRDALGGWHVVPEESMRAIRAAIGPEPPHTERVRVVRAGERVTFSEAAELVLENGSRESLPDASLPLDVPLGYHSVEFSATGRRMTLIVVPKRCHPPPAVRVAAWSVQLYAARSRRSWGIGDFGDLSTFAAWAREHDAGMLLVNPLHAATPTLPQTASPYSPTTRRFLNPLYLKIQDVPGARTLPDLEEYVRAGKQLNRAPLIERDAIFRLKMRALEALFSVYKGGERFDAYVRAGGSSLWEYTVHSALAQRFGPSWRKWPMRYRHPHSRDVRRFADEHHQHVRFHAWVQWLLDMQFQRASRELPVMQDLPIGIDPDGADAWAWQDILADGMTVGAPPDEFNTQGQNWGLPPFIPARLRAVGYGPFIETIRGTLRHAGGLRIDHVMGLFRLFWIPDGMPASSGAFVRNAARDLIGIVALESQRARAVIVGEDLGTIDEDAREQLTAAGILSYRLLWFEKRDPATYPRQALAAVTTHDLPTIAGLWTGSDLEAQRALNLKPNEEATREITQRLAKLTRSNRRTPLPEVVRRTYVALGRAPSAIVAAMLDDAAVAERRPNMPSTTTEWPNWSQPLPEPLEALCRKDLTAALAKALAPRPIQRVREMAADRGRAAARPAKPHSRTSVAHATAGRQRRGGTRR
jgi:4-alpha-glucanotransferase